MPDRPDLDVLTAIHHPVRRRMLEFLRLNGPSTVGVMAAALGQQVGSVSHHLKTLERNGLVEPAPELARDRRESWWRRVPRRVSWSITDFDDSPTDRLVAAAAERANLHHHADKVTGWLTDREQADPVWVGAAFATDQWATATPEELGDLADRINDLLTTWAGEVARATAAEEGERRGRRTPVFVFAHGNPARP